jgi:hypothetical protein
VCPNPARDTYGGRSNGPGTCTAAALGRRYLPARRPSTHHASLRHLQNPCSSPRPQWAAGKVRRLRREQRCRLGCLNLQARLGGQWDLFGYAAMPEVSTCTS